jgi:rubrerythrin
MFRSLADEEARHERILGRQLQAIAEGAAGDLPASVIPGGADLVSTFFPEGAEARRAQIPLDTSDLDALLSALGLENDSLELYRELTEGARDLAERRVFEYLAGEDRAHLDLLMLNYEYISKVGWRSQQGQSIEQADDA